MAHKTTLETVLLADATRDFQTLLAHAGTGQALIVHTAQMGRQLSIGGLAGRVVLDALCGENAQPKAHVLNCGSNLPTTKELKPGKFCSHGAQWIASGAIYEKFITALRDHRPTHVFCLDPWAVMLSSGAVGLLPDAKWVFISDLDSRKHTGDAEYWSEFAAWSKDLPLHVVPARAALPLVNEAMWTLGEKTVLHERLHPSSARITLIEEAEDHLPLLAALSNVLRDGSTVLLTPHLARYEAEHKELLERCTLALDTSLLSSTVYATLLSCCDEYQVSGDLPFGQSPIRALKLAPRRITQPTVNAAVPLGRSRLPQSLQRAQSALAVQSDEKEEPSEHTWWRGLSALTPPSPSSTEVPERGEERQLFDFGILTCCFKYLQRFRVFLDSIARQKYPLDRIEVCVALPGNPDGVREYLDLFRIAHPKLKVTAVDVAEEDRRNRGKMINAAFQACSSRTVMVADCDLVLPVDFVDRMVREGSSEHVLGCWRTALSNEVTAQIVTGNLDPIPNEVFGVLRSQWDPREAKDVREGILGYCQVVSREAFALVGYPEEFNAINQSDIVFIERLRESARIAPRMLEDLHVLHLAHPRDWSGTKVFL